MNEGKRVLDETEEIFTEHFKALDKAEKVKANPDIPQRALLIEYMQLTESFERLLKTTVRISKLGDKAQQKLIKYKELMDTMRDIS
ncbi:MAG: hypothetical protein V1773_01715 [bacterium]